MSVRLALLVRVKAAVRTCRCCGRGRGPDRARAAGGGRTEDTGQAECQRGARSDTGNAEARETCQPPPLVRAAPAGDRGQRWPLGRGHFRQGIAQFLRQGAVVRVLVVVHRSISVVVAGASSSRRAVMARDR